jgi:5-methyltetrahydrofolate--homocysteine methyltransferase
LSLIEARQRRLSLSFSGEHAPVRPNKLGVTAFNSVDLNTLIDYIDWKPFFEVFMLRGKYPNRAYPRIFDDETVGAEAKSLFEDAKQLLRHIIDKNLLKAKVKYFLS